MARILLIDDDDQFREMLAEILAGAGYEVVEARNGNAGAKAQYERPADLVITDIVMPEKEGLEVIRELRRQDPEVGIIAISGGGCYSGAHYLEVAEKLGADRALAKPFKRRDLLESISEILGHADRKY